MTHATPAARYNQAGQVMQAAQTMPSLPGFQQQVLDTYCLHGVSGTFLAWQPGSVGKRGTLHLKPLGTRTLCCYARRSAMLRVHAGFIMEAVNLCAVLHRGHGTPEHACMPQGACLAPLHPQHLGFGRQQTLGLTRKLSPLIPAVAHTAHARPDGVDCSRTCRRLQPQPRPRGVRCWHSWRSWRQNGSRTTRVWALCHDPRAARYACKCLATGDEAKHSMLPPLIGCSKLSCPQLQGPQSPGIVNQGT